MAFHNGLQMMKKLSIFLISLFFVGELFATIVDSIIVEDSTQTNGRRYIRERHEDQLGNFYFRALRVPSDYDKNAGLIVGAAFFNSQLKENEIRKNLKLIMGAENGENPVLTYDYSTANENAVALREIFKTLKAWEVVKVGRFIQNLGLSDAQLKNLFNINDAQLAALKVKLLNMKNKYDGIVTEEGE